MQYIFEFGKCQAYYFHHSIPSTTNSHKPPLIYTIFSNTNSQFKDLHTCKHKDHLHHSNIRPPKKKSTSNRPRTNPPHSHTPTDSNPPKTTIDTQPPHHHPHNPTHIIFASRPFEPVPTFPVNRVPLTLMAALWSRSRSQGLTMTSPQPWTRCLLSAL